MRIAVWFSCGAASAVALKLAIDKYGKDAVLAVNNPVLEEHPDNLRFKKEVSEYLQIPIEEAKNSTYPEASAVGVWAHRRYMSGVAGAPCTTQLKKEARYQWEAKNVVDYHILGFTADEEKRHKRFISTERENVLPILIQEGFTKKHCFDEVQRWGISLPAMYHLGYPNANCIGCVKSSSPAYWNHVRKVHPAIFEERARQSRELGCRLVEKTFDGVKHRYFLDELPESWGAGRKLGPMPECSSFCEEGPIK